LFSLLVIMMTTTTTDWSRSISRGSKVFNLHWKLDLAFNRFGLGRCLELQSVHVAVVLRLLRRCRLLFINAANEEKEALKKEEKALDCD